MDLGENIMALKRILGGGALNAARGLEGFLGGNVQKEDIEGIQDFLRSKGIKSPIDALKPSRRSDYILQALGGKESELQPQGFGERLAQDITSTGLGYLLGGGPRNLKSFKPVAAGSIAGSTAGELGLPEWAQTAAQVGTEFGLKRKSLAKEGKIPLSRKAHTQETYNKLKKSLAQYEKGSAEPLNEYMQEAKSYWKREADSDTLKAAENIVETIRSNIDSKGNIDIRNAYEIGKNLNQQYKNAPSALKPYIQDARKALKQTLIEHSPKNPEFGKLWQEATELHQYDKANNIISDFIADIPGIRKLKFIPDLLSKLELPSPRLFANKSARKYYFDLVDAVFKEDKSAVLRSASKLAKQEIAESPSEFEGWQRVTNPESDFGGWSQVR